jgi:hypothetical protein
MLYREESVIIAHYRVITVLGFSLSKTDPDHPIISSNNGLVEHMWLDQNSLLLCSSHKARRHHRET